MSRLWSRAFAAIYDPMMSRADRAGVGAHRQAVADAAHGRVLEIGAGTGRNLALYGAAVTELVLSEPDPAMVAKLEPKLASAPVPVTVVHAGAERLPFADASFDCVVSTLVLCTVPEVEPSLAEARRVLKPGGRFLFLEHVRSADPGFAKWQDRLHGPWRVIGDGCHCNRDTAAAITGAGFSIEVLAHDEIKDLGLARPLIRGVASR
jgi:ubiquinone/menaquinone biosynthesis C-methylase UbiE